jgi:hypothetical protein
MALTDKLRSLDQRILPGTREPDEDAETYLRRVAQGRAISPAQVGDVMVALQEHLGVGGGAPKEESDEQQSDSADEHEDAHEDEEADEDEDES